MAVAIKVIIMIDEEGFALIDQSNSKFEEKSHTIKYNILLNKTYSIILMYLTN